MLTLLKSDSDPRQSDCLCDRKRIRSCLGTLYNVHFSFGQLWICFRFYAFSCRPYCVSFDRQKWSYNKMFLDFLINQCSNIIKNMDSTRWIISWPDSVFSCSWHQQHACWKSVDWEPSRQSKIPRWKWIADCLKLKEPGENEYRKTSHIYVNYYNKVKL